MKKILAIALLAILAVISCQKEPKVVNVTAVTLDVMSTELTEGESTTLTATVSPENADNKKVLWSTSDASVATVSNGTVSAIKVGTVKIIATSEDGGKTATCVVNVKAKIINVSNVSLNKTTLELTEGDSETLTATIAPENATNKKVTWSSSDKSIATVSDGKVTAVKAGTTTITVKTEDGSKTAECKVTVKAKVYAVTGVSLNKSSLELTEGDSETLTATITPDNATNKKVTWSSSNSSVATVSEGKITAVKAGTATITVKTEDGSKTAECKVTVKAKVYAVTGVSLNKSSLELTEGDIETLTATIAPSNATNKNVTWSSSNSSVATVSEGKITAVKVGTATITVKTEDGSKTAECKVTVKAKVYAVTGVSLNKSSLELTEGNSETLTATIAPDNATNKKVTWSSSNSSVATVSEGKITAVKAGTATITVKTEDGGKTAECKVTVKAKSYNVTGVTLNTASLVLMTNDTETLVATIEPDYAKNKSVTWSSSDESIATVSSNGVVKGVKMGNAVITVKTEDGGYTATCDVAVVDISAYISASFSSVTVSSGSLELGKYAKVTAGVKFGVSLTNRSNYTIKLTKVKLYCSLYGTGNYWTVDSELESNMRITYTVPVNSTMYSPIVEFEYVYNGETYTAKSQYTGSVGYNSVPIDTGKIRTKEIRLPAKVEELK